MMRDKLLDQGVGERLRLREEHASRFQRVQRLFRREIDAVGEGGSMTKIYEDGELVAVCNDDQGKKIYKGERKTDN